MKTIEYNLDKMCIYAYGYGCYHGPFNGDAEVEIDMQEYIRPGRGRGKIRSIFPGLLGG